MTGDIDTGLRKKIYLVGTVHVSKESARRVEKIVQEAMPNMVCLELDKARFQALLQKARDDVRAKSGISSGGFDKEDREPKTENRNPGERGQFRYSGGLSRWIGSGRTSGGGPGGIPRRGLGALGPAGLFGPALQWLQQKIGEEFGVMPGVEMLAAVRAAGVNKVPIALIDRPVQVSLNRMMHGMGFKEKAKMFTQIGLLSGLFLLKPLFGERVFKWLSEDRKGGVSLKQVESGAGLADLLKLFKEEFPTVYRVLVEERNEYMAKNIIQISGSEGKDTLVVVVGLGHIPGLRRLLEAEGCLDVVVVQ